jgi:predicted neuraminidase
VVLIHCSFDIKFVITETMATTTTTVLEPPEFDSSLRASASRSYSYAEAFIPALTTQCHASNLLLLPSGDLLCAWFGGSIEGRPDICIYMSRLPAGQKVWTEAKKMTHDHTRSEQNPLLFRNPSNGEVRLLYTSQDAGNQDSAIVKQLIADENGVNWSDPTVLFSDPGTFIRQPIVVLPNRAWVVPIFKCRAEPGTRWLGSDDISCIRISKDEGKTWSEREIPNSYGCVHMNIQRLKDGTYLGLYRSRWADRVYLSTSPDGLDWTEPKTTVLPNPNAGICFDVLPSGRVVLVYNHSSKKDALGRRDGLYDDISDGSDTRANQATKHEKEAFWGAPRAPLCVAWSDDGGLTWDRKTLEDGDGYCLTNNSEKKLNRELSYPSILVEDNGTIHVAFTFWRQRIKYMQLKEDFFEH